MFYFRSAGLYSLSVTIVSESVPLAKRNLVVLLVTSIFLVSQGIMAGIYLTLYYVQINTQIFVIFFSKTENQKYNNKTLFLKTNIRKNKVLRLFFTIYDMYVQIYSQPSTTFYFLF